MSGDFNVGSDSKLTIISGGTRLSAKIRTGFEAKQITSKLKSVASDGVNRYRELEEGWEGTLEFDRADSTLDDFFALKEANRYAGIAPPSVTITETNSELNGSITIYRFDGVTLKMDTAGKRDGDKKVDVKIGWTASRRIKVQ